MGARRVVLAAATLFVLAFVGGLLSCAGPSHTPSAESAAAAPAAAPSALVPFRTGTFPEELWGYRTADGEVVIPPRFRFATEFREGLARVWVPAELQGEGAEAGEEALDARERFRWGYVAPSGEWAIPPRYEAAADFGGGEALVLDRGEYLLVDRAGEVRQRLGSEAGTGLPLPSDSCTSLEQYMKELGTLSPVHTLLANPIVGESVLTLEVQRLRFGAIEVRELGWEGMSFVLVLPLATRAEADAIVQRLLRHHAHKEITAQRVFDDLVTYELLASELAGEFFRIRARPGGGFEIHHTQWAA
jgi:hypothetical protein